MQRVVLALAVTLIGTSIVAALPSAASANARNQTKIKHTKYLQARYQKKAQRVVTKAKHVVQLERKGSNPRIERKAERDAKKTQRVVEIAHKHDLVQVEPHRATHDASAARPDAPDTTNALVALAMRYDGENPTGSAVIIAGVEVSVLWVLDATP